MGAVALFLCAASCHAQSQQDSPGARAYRELKEHLDYIWNQESTPLPDTVTIPEKALRWPGMNRFEIIDCVNLLWQAQVIVLKNPIDPSLRPTPVWLHDVRGYRKANGWYGVRINGEPMDESQVWFLYGGQEVNLQMLFSYGSRMINLKE